MALKGKKRTRWKPRREAEGRGRRQKVKVGRRLKMSSAQQSAEDSSSMGGPPSAEEQRQHCVSAASEGSSSQDKVTIAELPNQLKKKPFLSGEMPVR